MSHAVRMEPRDVVLQFVEAFNRGDAGALASLLCAGGWEKPDP